MHHLPRHLLLATATMEKNQNPLKMLPYRTDHPTIKMTPDVEPSQRAIVKSACVVKDQAVPGSNSDLRVDGGRHLPIKIEQKHQLGTLMP